VPFGGSLTAVATLPEGATRSLDDPFAEKKRPWKAWLFLAVVVIVLLVLWRQGVFAGLFG
jgi:hypothetical protein